MHRTTLRGDLANSRSALTLVLQKTTTGDQLCAGLLRVSTAD
jgi:hypothetical protein